ncbi:MAG: hypothetical protein KJ065_28495, partial [Anaerolineae bacterium]|nr:hypothetical protein [Anaerolineae bacterium]
SPHFSHEEAHRGAESAKVVVLQRHSSIRGTPRCRQTVAQNGLILEPLKGVLWTPHSMRAW